MANHTFAYSNEAAAAVDHPFLHVGDEPSALDRFRRRASSDAAPATLPWSDDPSEYAILQSGLPPRTDEVEQPGTRAVEIAVLWGDMVLDVHHLSPPRSFHVGEAQGPEGFVDQLLPAEELGASRLPLVECEGDTVYVVIPAGATGRLERGRETLTLEEARRGAEAAVGAAGAARVPVDVGARARVELGAFTFSIGVVTAGKKSKRSLAGFFDRAAAGWFAGAMVATAALVGAMAAFVPPLGLTNDEGMDRDRLYVLQQYLDANAEDDVEETPDPTPEDGVAERGGTGKEAKGEEGKMGEERSAQTNKHYALKKTSDGPLEIPREQAFKEAQEFGMIGMLASFNGHPDVLTAPWGGDMVNGADDVNVVGGMFGDEIGADWGIGGLAPSGIGEGGGGKHEGIGMGDIGTIGRGYGIGDRDGFGRDRGLGKGTHATKTPQMRVPFTTVNGRLPPEVIQRTVRQNFGRFRMCYENGLRTNPNLEGRVAVRFVIGRDGAVSNVSNGGSDLPDAGVTSCIISAFYGLSFPSPEDGIVSVVYPLSLTPG